MFANDRIREAISHESCAEWEVVRHAYAVVARGGKEEPSLVVQGAEAWMDHGIDLEVFLAGEPLVNLCHKRANSYGSDEWGRRRGQWSVGRD